MKTQEKPTPMQERYLSFIRAYTEQVGFPPAESEIAEAKQVMPSTVNQMMKTLESKGFIRRTPGVARSIEILLPPESIPAWEKPIVVTRRQWMVNPSSLHAGGKKNRSNTVYRLKITLDETQPPIWRRIETRDVTLKQLHELIQTAMGWTNSHLHCFEIGRESYTDPMFLEEFGAAGNEESYDGMKISDLVSRYGTRKRWKYLYDYGDNWRHTIKVEKVLEAEPTTRYPRCIDGARKCPPEDVGGVWGYVEFLDAISDPDHPEHDEFLEWSGPFDSEAFDPVQATRDMRRGLPVW